MYHSANTRKQEVFEKFSVSAMKTNSKESRLYICAGGLLCIVVMLLVTPPVPHPQDCHNFADKRNFHGVPNTLNVISTFPFLIVGIIGFVLCLHGNYFGLSIRGEVWCWIFFYAGIAGTAFGSAYYHLKPEDERLFWDRLPMTIAFVSVTAVFIIERIDERAGFASLFPLLTFSIVSIAYWRLFSDIRLYAFVQLAPFIAIPAMAAFSPPKYTHSKYWIWAAGSLLLAEIAEATDKKFYKMTYYTISGHTFKHLSASVVPILLTIMLARRSIKIERDS